MNQQRHSVMSKLFWAEISLRHTPELEVVCLCEAYIDVVI